MRVSNTFTVNVIYCPLKANTWRLNIKCWEKNKPKQYTNTWQVIEVSNSGENQRSNTQMTVEIMQTYDLLKFALAQSNGSNFLLTTQ